MSGHAGPDAWAPRNPAGRETKVLCPSAELDRPSPSPSFSPSPLAPEASRASQAGQAAELPRVRARRVGAPLRPRCPPMLGLL
ncbi:Hypothetical protein I596_2056 [Dokdonella koreensis DS-123]|uniref:Uncharacterized protein n=1 Tax=Dokdonella koreensis DS-123 TaxID=1300342 RepID=A0A160DUE3_9GAMM|nr:Hypothetical protein I596_2056 [Dokdonella koreensis DS-123]